MDDTLTAARDGSQSDCVGELTPEEVRRLRSVARRAAYRMRCDFYDAEQQAYLEALESLRCCPAYRGGALARRVHGRLIGRYSALRRHQLITASVLFDRDGAEGYDCEAEVTP